MEKKKTDTVISEVIGNLKNLDQVMAHLENREDGDVFSLIRANLSSDMEKLQSLLES